MNKHSNDFFLMSRKNDYVFKRIFGDTRNKSVLIDFLNAVLTEEIQDVEILNNELKREHIEDKQGILDVKARTDKGIYIDIEIQIQHTVSMPKRTLYYWSKLYTEQLSPGGSYDELSKTVTINIMNYPCIPNEKKHNKFLLLEHESHEVLTDILEIHFLELSKLQQIDFTSLEPDELTEWMLFIDTPAREVLEMLAKKNKEIKKAYNILEAMSKNKEERMLYESRQAALHDQITREKENYQKGLEEGIEQGIEKGIEKGRIETQLQIAKGMKTIGISDEDIMKATGLTADELKKALQ